MEKNKPNFKERLISFLDPEAGQKAYRERIRRERASSAREAAAVQMAATGYGNYGANTTKTSMMAWNVGGGSAEDDIDLHGALLRKRSRDLYAAGGLARSGPATLTSNVVAWGIRPRPNIDSDFLGLSDEQKDEWERNTLREFKLWAENSMCDAERKMNFYKMQQLAFRSMLMSGDVFVLFGMKENPTTPYQTTLRILESDRISTPDGTEGESESRETDGGGRIIDGVEIDREGAVIRYHISNRHPLMEESNQELSWVAVDAFGKETGQPNILHVMVQERPEQRRGIPFISSQIEMIKQLERYLGSELAANIVASYFGVMLTNDDTSIHGLEDSVNEDEKVTDDDLYIELGPGTVFDLPPGKKPVTVNPMRSNTAFESFVGTYETIIGAGIEIPKEQLIHKYDSNYTAARGAKLDFWRTVMIYRSTFNTDFCQPCYEAWLSEAVATGRIEAPGFFDDPAIREAWCGCQWMGASMGHIDPKKEVEAAEKRIALNISTEEQEAREYNGNDWNANIRQRRKEREAMSDTANGQSGTARNNGE